MSFRQGARQFFEKRGAPTPPLPYDYAVEYIETDGVASYINTGIQSTDDLSWELDFQLNSIPVTSSDNVGSICGARVSGYTFNTGRNMALVISTKTGIFTFATPSYAGVASLDLSRHTAYSSLSLIKFDNGEYQPTSSTVISGYDFCLGKDGEASPPTNVSKTYSNVRIYSCVLRDNGVVVFNGTPVVANGAAGLYDSISGTFKGNAAASGTITAGPRV